MPPLPLHLPLHGRGRGLPAPLQRLLRRQPGRWDLPELPGFGGPLIPGGAVAEAQRRTAALYGARRCWFGVNGASGLLQAALLGLCPPGSRVLLPRNHHRSLLHACVLGDLEPLLFDLPFDRCSGLWLPPPPEHLERVLAAAPTAAALVLVDPTYQGRKGDLPALVERAHAADLPVVVDQAHGDGDALAAGADLVVLSPQKGGGGLAQGAALFSQGHRAGAEALERALLWLQTSSPSALLLASTAVALGHARSGGGRRQRQRAERRGLLLRHRLGQRGFRLLATDDPLRLVLITAAFGISGEEADTWLLRRGVVAELAEPGGLTFCLGLEPPPALERRLPQLLEALRRECRRPPLPPFQPPPLPLVAELAMPLRQAWRAAAETLPLKAAVGRIASAPLCPYPPGIPLLVPGERIDAERTAWLASQRQLWPGEITDTVTVVAE